MTFEMSSLEYTPQDIEFVVDEDRTGILESAEVPGWDIMSNVTDAMVRPITAAGAERTYLVHRITLARRALRRADFESARDQDFYRRVGFGCRRPQRPHPRPAPGEHVVGPSRNRNRRTCVPSKVAEAGVERRARREEEALQRVAETNLLA